MLGVARRREAVHGARELQRRQHQQPRAGQGEAAQDRAADGVLRPQAPAHRISIAVAGFSDSDLSVEVREKALIVSARKADEDEAKSYLHRGIATRAFERRFHLADHVQVIGAAHANGMLHIELERQVPEALKPRQIAISSEVKAIDKDVVDAKSVN